MGIPFPCTLINTALMGCGGHCYSKLSVVNACLTEVTRNTVFYAQNIMIKNMLNGSKSKYAHDYEMSTICY